MTLPALYELASEYREAAAALADLDLPPEVVTDTLEGMSGALTEKATNVGLYIRNMESFEEQIDKEIDRLVAKKKAVSNRVKHVREYLLNNMVACNYTKIESPYFTLTVRKNPPKVVIDDPEAVPMEYWRQPPIPAPELDKKKLAEDMKAGVVVEGSHMEQGVSLSIK